MKTVTIPTCANPFVVIINGRKYTYPAGETVEVPDEVAEIIERHEEAKPQPEDAPAPGGTTEILEVSSLSELPEDAADGTQAVIPQGKLPSGGGGGLPVVEITTVLTSDGANLSGEEAALLNNIGANPFILDVTLEVSGAKYPFRGVMNCAQSPNTSANDYFIMYSAIPIMGTSAVALLLIQVGDNWLMQYSKMSL